jgi:hypothetical protein
MQPLGGQQALEGVEGAPQSAQPAQNTPMPQEAPSPTPLSAAPSPNYYEQQQAMAATRTSPTGTVQARSKGNPNGPDKGDGNGGQGNGGGGQGNGGQGNGDGGGKPGDGKPGDGKKGGRPWYLQGLKMSDKGDKKIAQFLKTDPTFQQQVNDFLASRGDALSQFREKSDLIDRDFQKNIKFTKDGRIKTEGDLLQNMAASGLARSSGYSDEMGNIEDQFLQDRFNLVSDKNFGLQDVTAEKTNFLRQLQIMQQQAKSQALARRAAENFSFGGMIPTS